ncbi:MAG: hypothetical protein ACKPKO_02535, partial [Candidatus Fonsibacter sp.]
MDIIDEGQRSELLSGCAILGHTMTTWVVADSDKIIESRKNVATRSPWRQQQRNVGSDPNPRWSTLQKPMPIWLPAVLADEHKQHAHVFKLNDCNRC